MEKYARFFIATDKPLEKTKIYEFKPFYKIRDGEKKIVDKDAKDIEQLVKDVNDLLKIRFIEGSNYDNRYSYMDIIPFDLKNSDKIPKETLKKMEGVLLDLHSLRKEEVFEKLCDLMRRLEYMDMDIRRNFLDIFFIKNNKNATILKRLKNILIKKEFQQWHPCECYEDLKIEINTAMILLNHPRYKILFELSLPLLFMPSSITISPKSYMPSNLEVVKDIVGILTSMPEQKLKSINFEEFARIDEEEGKVLELYGEKALSIFSSNHEFGDWFLTEITQKVVNKPEDYFQYVNRGLDKLDQLEFEFANIKHQLELKIKGMIEKKNVVNFLVKNFEADFQNRYLHIDKVQIKYEIDQILNGIENFNSPLKGDVANSILEGKLFVCMNEKELDKESEKRLGCLGISKMKKFRLFDNTSENFSKLTEFKGLVDIAQFHTVEGQLDLVDLPWKF